MRPLELRILPDQRLKCSPRALDVSTTELVKSEHVRLLGDDRHPGARNLAIQKSRGFLAPLAEAITINRELQRITCLFRPAHLLVLCAQLVVFRRGQTLRHLQGGRGSSLIALTICARRSTSCRASSPASPESSTRRDRQRNRAVGGFNIRQNHAQRAESFPWLSIEFWFQSSRRPPASPLRWPRLSLPDHSGGPSVST